ncbi:hypothetical protein BD410DRAFT_786875 [Rickenella mellea]|uniref:Uncharacterized protein n=1 Tax=Rickenella mellea TaxID=50990 RepID=A0A4Y7Q8W1_9AGAM|nr:hypothetical protein BD410DRAFT_786875 [Rickenella mellea]
MGTLDPLVDFDCENRDVSIEKWRQFWDTTDSWLTERGYTLFEYGDEWNGNSRYYYAPKHSTVYMAEHPFSLYGGDTDGYPFPPLSAPHYHRIAFAQDSLDRHVVLKLMKDGSQEHRIARLLSKELSLFSLDAFNGILPPLDFLQLGKHWILVMPRWGDINLTSWFATF